MKRLLIILSLMVFSSTLATAQQEAENKFDLDAQIVARGELRNGGFHNLSGEADAESITHFITGRTRLTAHYSRNWLEMQVTAQQSGVWGQAGRSVSVYQGWALMRSQSGLFAKIGRQELSYDDERILGSDDWSMAASSHDMIKLGYEGQNHKVHLLFAYNQNSEGLDGGTYYTDGSQPYKIMQTLWYHIEVPKTPLGISLIGMNIGMQGDTTINPGTGTQFQQLFGTYLSLRPEKWSLDGSFYYQIGKNENTTPIKAFMGSAKVAYRPSDKLELVGGYDYLSGDDKFAVPAQGTIGISQHSVIKGFSSLFGSHHEFYGAMDFFYVRTYHWGFTPGLQNLYLGGEWKPTSNLTLNTAYHYFAIATTLEDLGKTLGHEIELNCSWKPIKDISISAGYSFMYGTETMEALKRTTDKHRLHWAWISFSASPRILTKQW